MNRGILPILFFYLIERTVVQGFFPFLPIIANNITHNNRHASIYLTICYSALFLGSMLTDKVCNIGFSIKKLILINSIPLALLIGVIGLQKNIVFLTIVTAVAYFLIGLQINYVSIMVSSLSTTDKVGRNFGALNNVLLFGTVFGGFIVGPFIDGFGYNVAFEILGIALLLAYIPIIFVSLPEKKIISKTFDKAILTPSFVWLLLIISIGTMLTQVGRFCLVIDMKNKNYSLSNISYVFAIGTLLVFPLPYIYGYLSSKISNKVLLLSTLLALALSFFVLHFSHTWLQFLVVILLISVMLYCSKVVCNKICYELYPEERQATVQSWLASANWLAIILGYGWIGFASDKQSVSNISIIGLILAVTILILGFLKFKWKENIRI